MPIWTLFNCADDPIEHLIMLTMVHMAMNLGPSPKRYTADGHRSVDPKQTLARVEPLCDIAGIRAIKELTCLDRVGIPVFTTVRDDPIEGRTWSHNGKGASPEQAKASAIMESMERHAAEYRGQETKTMHVEEMMSSHWAVDPRELILPMRTLPFVMYERISWVKGFDLLSNEEIYLPSCAVFHPYHSRSDLQLFRSHTNGIASGNTMEEAVLHGLLELIERDAWSICEFQKKTYHDIVETGEGSVSHDLLCKFAGAGIEIHLKDLTSDLGIPTFAAAADDVWTKDPNMLMIGVGTHLDPEMAAIRALTEVAQSRATHIEGSRVDAEQSKRNIELGYERMKELNSMWFEPSADSVSIRGVNGEDTDDLYDDMQVVLEHLSIIGFDKVIAVDLTREDIGVPVIRIVVPFLEVYTMDPERQGHRLFEVPISKNHRA